MYMSSDIRVLLLALILLVILVVIAWSINIPKHEEVRREGSHVDLTGIKVYIICKNSTIRNNLVKYLEGLGAILVKKAENADICIIDAEANLTDNVFKVLGSMFLEGKGIIVFSSKAHTEKMARILKEITSLNKTVYLKFKDFIDRLERIDITLTFTKTYPNYSMSMIKTQPYIYAVGIKLGYEVYNNKTYVYPITSSSMCQSVEEILKDLPEAIAFILSNLTKK